MVLSALLREHRHGSAASVSRAEGRTSSKARLGAGMDPITLIVAALGAGAASGVTDVAGQAVQDAYAALKGLVARKLKSGEGPIDPASLLTAYETQPEAYQAALEAELGASGADRDRELVTAAEHLLSLADPDGAASGKYRVDLRGATGVQVGDHGTMTVNVSPRKRRE